MINKLRRQFVVFNMAVITLVIVAALTAVYFMSAANIENGTVTMMRSISLEPMRGRGRPDEMRDDVRLPFFTVRLDEQGEILARGGGYFDLSDEDLLKELVSEADSSGEESGIIKKYNLRYLALSDPSRRSLYVFADMTSEQNALNGLRRGCVRSGIAAFAVFLVMSVIMSGWVVKPVGEAWKEQKQFVADASHELKTPLTVIMTNAELLQSEDFTAEQKKGFASAISAMSGQMRGLVESLLDLTRVESAGAETVFGEVDFSSAVESAVMQFEPVFYERGLSISSKIERNIHVKGDSAKLARTAEILLDNAQKYSSPGGETKVTLSRSGSSCILTVANPGEAISGEDLANIFKRFYRGDKARSMNHSYGLGLAIAKETVALHKGTVSAESSGGVNTFTVRLPSA